MDYTSIDKVILLKLQLDIKHSLLMLNIYSVKA